MSKTNRKIQYVTYPSDDDEWIIIELVDKKIKLDLNKEVLTFRYDCIPHDVDVGGVIVPCSRFCCYDGCYISPKEIKEAEKILPELIKEGYLQEDSLEVLKRNNNEIIVPDDYDEEEDLYKTRCAPCEPDELEDSEFSEKDKENEKDQKYHKKCRNDQSLEFSERESADAGKSKSRADSNTVSNRYEARILNGNEADIGNETGNENESGNENDTNNEKEFFTFSIDDVMEGLEKESGQSIADYSTLENNIKEIPKTHCIFLMKNGYCATHAYYNDHNIDWTINKFNICTTFPMDLRVSINDADDAPYPNYKRVDDECSTLKMMDDFEEFLFTRMDCIHLHPYIKAKKGVPYILDSMKYAIVTRLGEEMWYALKHYAAIYRKRLKLQRSKSKVKKN